MGYKSKFSKFISRWINDSDFDFLLLVFSLAIIGFIAVATSNQSMAKRINISNFDLLKKHLFFSLVGVALMILFSMFSIDFIYFLSKIMTPFFILTIIFTITFGYEVKGSKRWLDIGGISIQPGEILKPFFFTFQNFIITVGKNVIWLRVLIVLSILTFVVFLFFLQPDIGTALLYILISVIQLFFSYTSKEIIFLMLIGFLISGSFAYFLMPHVYGRINLFTENKLAYQTQQSINAIQNGHYFGNGIGGGLVKYNIPDSYTDYIFSVLFEEFGFFIMLFILFLYGKLFFGTFIKLREKFVKKIDLNLFSLGISLVSLLFFQTFVNIGVAINLLPSKGMTMPLISYGGSSIISTYIILGIIMAILRKNNTRFVNKYAL